MPQYTEENCAVVFKDEKMFIKTPDGRWYEVKAYM